MNYILDTCVISELIKKDPDKNVMKWVSGVDESALFISVISIGEIIKGIEKLTGSQRKDDLIAWVNNDLKERFQNRIVPFDLESAAVWGRVQAKSENIGKPLPGIDGMIASTGIANNMAVATRNIADMKESGAVLFNPWTGRYSNQPK
jgi:toxin FitB